MYYPTSLIERQMVLPEKVACLELDQVSSGGKCMCGNNLLLAAPGLLVQDPSLGVDQAEGARLLEGKAKQIRPWLISWDHAKTR